MNLALTGMLIVRWEAPTEGLPTRLLILSLPLIDSGRRVDGYIVGNQETEGGLYGHNGGIGAKMDADIAPV